MVARNEAGPNRPKGYYMPTARWPRWLTRLWVWAFRWRMYERGYVDGWDAAERLRPRERKSDE